MGLEEGKVVDEGTEKRGLHHDYTSWWSIYDFPTITLALSEYQLPGKEDDGQGRGKKKKNSSHHKQDIVYSTICPVD